MVFLEVLVKLYDIHFLLVNTYFSFLQNIFYLIFKRKIENKVTPYFHQKIKMSQTT